MTLAKLNDKMKKKLAFGDYTLAPEPVKAPPPSARKLYALSQEDGEKLHEIFKSRSAKSQPLSISEIMSEAITRLHEQEHLSQ